jgi:hypothetical protein
MAILDRVLEHHLRHAKTLDPPRGFAKACPLLHRPPKVSCGSFILGFLLVLIPYSPLLTSQVPLRRLAALYCCPVSLLRPHRSTMTPLLFSLGFGEPESLH